MVVYKTTNLVNGKIYICKDTKNNSEYLGSGLILNKAIKKYGKENFGKEILEECKDQIILAEREKYWIAKYMSTNRNIGYNITEGGLGGDTFSNNPNKEKIREKIKAGMAKYIKKHGHAPMCNDPVKRSEIAKAANAVRTENGYKHSDETKKKLSATLTGRVFTDEWKKNISKATKEAMSNLNQKELQLKALEGRKKSWAKRDEDRKNKLEEILKLGLKASENIMLLGVSIPTYYKTLRMLKHKHHNDNSYNDCL